MTSDIPNLNDFSYAGIAMPKAVISLEEDDDIGNEQKVSFKKRTGLTKSVAGLSRKSQKLGAGDDSDIEEVLVRPKAVSKYSTRKFVSTKSGKNETVDKPEEESLTQNETKNIESKEPTPAPEYISVALSDSDVEKGNDEGEKGFVQALDLDEGLGFEDDRLALNENEKNLQDAIYKRDMKSAIEAYSSDEENGYDSEIGEYKKKKILSMAEAMRQITVRVEELKKNAQVYEEKLKAEENERSLIEEREKELKASFEKAGEELHRQLEKITASMTADMQKINNANDDNDGMSGVTTAQMKSTVS